MPKKRVLKAEKEIVSAIIYGLKVALIGIIVLLAIKTTIAGVYDIKRMDNIFQLREAKLGPF